MSAARRRRAASAGKEATAMARAALVLVFVFAGPGLQCVVPAVESAAAPVVRSVEPPNWWAHHSLDRVQLLIRGSGLAGAQLVPTVPGIDVESVRVSESGTTAIAYIRIHDTVATGAADFSLETDAGSSVVHFSLRERLEPAGCFAGLSTDDVIYLVMPDRFDDGDPSNDDPAESAGHYDRGKPFAYHGGDIAGLIARLPYLKDLGVTAVWLNPVYDNWDQGNDCHGYGATNFYDVEEHFGTVENLRELVDRAHALGIKVVQDQVANHTGQDHEWVSDYPTPTWYNGTPANHLDNSFDIEAIVDPSASASRRRTTLEGWFGGFLPDLNQRDPDAAAYLVQNSIWWVESTGLDAIRQDTLPYVPRPYWSEWIDALEREHPDFTVVGEVFNGSPGTVAFFQGGVARYDGIDSRVDTVFDFPLYFAISDVFAARYPTSRLRDVFAADGGYPTPSLLVPFLGNHDVPRFVTRAGGDTKSLELAQTFLLTCRGIPQLYYGDEIALPGGGDPDNRRDFPGGFPGDRRDGFFPGGRSKKQNRVFEHVRRLLALRTALPALRSEHTRVLLASDSVFAMARGRDGQGIVVVLNNSNSQQRVALDFRGIVADGERLVDGLGSSATAVAGPAARVSVRAHSGVVLVTEEEARSSGVSR